MPRFNSAMRKILVPALLTLLLGACRVVHIDDYVHEPTRQLRQSLIWSGDSAKGADGRDFVLVPNFRTFPASWAQPRASLYVASISDDQIQINAATLTNLGTGVTQDIAIGGGGTPLALKPRDGTDYFVGNVVLLDSDFDDVGTFNEAEALELWIQYSISGDDPLEETMLIERIIRRTLAFPT